jgi:hypothetical protein
VRELVACDSCLVEIYIYCRCVWKECSFNMRRSVVCDSYLDGMYVCCRRVWKECSFNMRGLVVCDSYLDGMCVYYRRVWKECSFMIRGIASCYRTTMSKVKKKPSIPTPKALVYKWMLRRTVSSRISTPLKRGRRVFY